MNIAYFAPGTIHDAKWLNEICNTHSVILFCDSDISDINRNHFDKKIVLVPLFEGYSMFNNKRVVSKIKSILLINKIELIHVLYAFPYVLYLNKLKEYKYIVTTRGSDILKDIPSLYLTNSLKELLLKFLIKKEYRAALKNAAHITSTSYNQQEGIRGFIGQRKNLHIIRSGVNFKQIDNVLENTKKREPIEEKVIFSPRSCLPHYNIDKIIEAFNLICDEYNDLKLIIINDKKDKEYFRHISLITKKHNLTNKVQFENNMGFEKLIKQYLNSWLVIMVPETDGSPNSAIESMYCKTTVLLGYSKYDDDIFNDNNCYLVKEKNISSIYNAIKTIIEEDPKGVYNKNNNAYKTVKLSLSLDESIKKLMHIYSKVSSSRA